MTIQKNEAEVLSSPRKEVQSVESTPEKSELVDKVKELKYSLEDESTSRSSSCSSINPSSKRWLSISDLEHFEREAANEMYINKLQLVRIIGKGSYGLVFLAKHEESGKFYALKKMPMKKLVSARQVVHVHHEKQILSSISHPFIVSLHRTSKDATHLNMLFEFVAGGELFTYLRLHKRFSVKTSKFYAAELTSALSFLHSRQIVYRDLKPENILLCMKGHVKITDFGFSKQLQSKRRTNTMCGTPEYVAPELITNEPHGFEVDWWSLGVLIYEMLSGTHPFRGRTKVELFKNIRDRKYRFYDLFDDVVKDLISSLLTEKSNRISADGVINHEWFSDIDWEEIKNLKASPPIVPQVSSEGDTVNFDIYDPYDPAEDNEASLWERQFFTNW